MNRLHQARNFVIATLLGAGIVLPAAVPAEEVSYWPGDEDDKALQQADNDVLQLQKARFRAIFANDEDEIERLEKEFRKAQAGRRELLRKTRRR